MKERERTWQRIRAAVFLVVGLTALVLVLLLFGHSESVFARRAVLHASFENVGGLIVGSDVRLGGVNVGVVKSIHFDPDPNVKRVDVDLNIVTKAMPRIRADSVARMNSKGVLGDMVVDITIGDSRQPPLGDGSAIRTAEAASLSRTLEEVEQVIGGVQTLVSDVNARVRETLTPQVATDVGRITHSTAQLLEDVQSGGGLAHQLIYDKRLAADTAATVHGAQDATESLARSLANVDALLARVRDGDGLLHGMIYAQGGTRAAEDLRRMASDLAGVADAVRTGPSLAHSVLYDPDQAELVDDLGQMARILRRLAEEVDEGKGTVGGLLKDPTAYQDLTELLGNLKRNAILKAAIRLTIHKDSLTRPAEPAYGGSGKPPPSP